MVQGVAPSASDADNLDYFVKLFLRSFDLKELSHKSYLHEKRIRTVP
jgi:hypothetical protein